MGRRTPAIGRQVEDRAVARNCHTATGSPDTGPDGGGTGSGLSRQAHSSRDRPDSPRHGSEPLVRCMKLPHAEKAQVDREKVTGYSLCTSHPDGASKAAFFSRHGFTAEAWEVLAEAPQDHGWSHPVCGSVPSAYGTRYSVDGPLESPDGRNPKVRTVWIVEHGSETPRLVTAYPLKEKE